MRIFVAGAGGYIGIPLCEALVERKHTVIAGDRFFFGKRPDVTCVRIDTRSITTDALGGFDAVVDLAGLSNDASAEIDSALTHSINVGGGCRLIDAATQAGVRRYVYSSSASVYGEGHHTMLSETDRCWPQTSYAHSKVAIENVLRATDRPGFEPVILRNATVFGVAPRMRFDLAVNVMTLRAWRDGLIYVMGGGEQWRPFIHVSDVVQAFVLVLEAPADKVAGETFNVGSQFQQLRICELADMVARQFPDARVHRIPDNPDRRSYHLSFEKIRERLGFIATTSVMDGIDEVRIALESGLVSGDDPTCYTLQYYKALIEWDKRIAELKMDGRLL